jgi:hypothetical protein
MTNTNPAAWTLAMCFTSGKVHATTDDSKALCGKRVESTLQGTFYGIAAADCATCVKAVAARGLTHSGI